MKARSGGRERLRGVGREREPGRRRVRIGMYKHREREEGENQGVSETYGETKSK